MLKWQAFIGANLNRRNYAIIVNNADKNVLNIHNKKNLFKMIWFNLRPIHYNGTGDRTAVRLPFAAPGIEYCSSNTTSYSSTSGWVYSKLSWYCVTSSLVAMYGVAHVKLCYWDWNSTLFFFCGEVAEKPVLFEIRCVILGGSPSSPGRTQVNFEANEL